MMLILGNKDLTNQQSVGILHSRRKQYSTKRNDLALLTKIPQFETNYIETAIQLE